MATGIAVGNFAQGLSQGLKSGMDLVNTKRKADREQERYDMELPGLKLQKDINDRRLASKTQANEEFGAWKQANLLDPNGNPLPEDQRPSQLMVNQAYFNLLTKAELDNQAVDPESFAQRQKLGQMFKAEGIMNAVDVWNRTNDTAETLKAFNAFGKSKAPEGTTFKTVTDAMGIQDVAIVGPDGKMLGTFNQALFFMSADNVAKNYSESKRAIFEQGQANQRTAISAGAQLKSAKINANASMDRQLLNDANNISVAQINARAKGVQDPVFDRVSAVVQGMAEKFAGNSGASLNPEKFQKDTFLAAGMTYKFITEAQAKGESLDPFTAAAMAFEILGYGNDPAAPTTK